MFKNAIKNNLECVKAIETAYKTPYNDELITSMYSIVLINDEGWALTTRQVVNNIIAADKIHEIYEKVREELILNKIPPKKIYKKYELNDDSPIIWKNVFLNAVTSWSGLKIIVHDYLDLALIKFEEPKEILCKSFPVFAKDNSTQGESLCRLGYPYSDYQAFMYDHTVKDIVLNNIVDNSLQVMPLDGMLTRYIADEKGNPTLFELSGNSFLGQVGGPIINDKGEIVGLKIGSVYKDSDLDLKTKIKRKHKKIDIEQYSLIPFSICINVKTLKEFLDNNSIKYNTK